MLVIIGLVIGGVLVGRDLIEASRIRQMGSEINSINTAITTFKLKYNCLPGDCLNATDVFGINSSGCPNGGGATGTCNGNGDGFVNGFSGGGAGNIEHFWAWQQLALATPGLFSLTANGTGVLWTNVLVGQNIPASKYNPRIGYNFFSVRVGAAAGGHKKTIEIGAESAAGALDVLCGAGLTGPEAYSLDSKFDDGLPEKGKIIAVSGGSTIPAYTTIATRASIMNSNTSCVSSGAYLTSAASGCTLESKVDVP